MHAKLRTLDEVVTDVPWQTEEVEADIIASLTGNVMLESDELISEMPPIHSPFPGLLTPVCQRAMTSRIGTPMNTIQIPAVHCGSSEQMSIMPQSPLTLLSPHATCKRQTARWVDEDGDKTPDLRTLTISNTSLAAIHAGNFIFGSHVQLHKSWKTLHELRSIFSS